MCGYAIKIDKLEKVYPGGVRALNGIDLYINEGEIFGLIGPNGAGKSTTIKILTTLLKPTGGRVEILGNDVADSPMEVRRIISYLPEDAGAYEQLTGREYLRFMAGFFDTKNDANAMVEHGIKIARLGNRIDSKIKEYSKGMKRRILIARTLMTHPRVAVLDEPTAGLDVMHGYYVRQEIKDSIRNDKATAVISSHNLLEVEFLCDRVALINRGNILDCGTPSELKKKYNSQNLEEAFFGAVRGGENRWQTT